MYDFETPIDRRGSHSMKWDIAEGELPMWVADMDFLTAPAVADAIRRRAAHGVYGYTVVPEAWYDAYIGWWRDRHGLLLEREWLQFTTGVVPAISCLVKRLTNPGDNVVAITPVFDIFFHSIENAGRHTLECPLSYSGGKYALDFGRLEEALAHPLSTMLLLCNPHNPTGILWTKEELRRIGALCKKHGVVVLSDEIHCELTPPGKDYVPFASASEECADNSVTCLSASKAFNLAGLQSAAVCVRNERLRNIAVRGLNSDEVAEPNCFAIDAVIAAFREGGGWLDELRAYLYGNRMYAEQALRDLPCALPVKADATYLLWIDCGALTEDADPLCAFLRERTGLILSAGSEYRGNGKRFLRMNLACPRSVLADGLNRLKRGITQYVGQKK